MTSTPIKKNRLSLWSAVAVVVALAGYFAVDRFMPLEEEKTEGWDNSVAVLIFRNLSGDEDQDIFCEGMTEEIIGRLTTIKSLKVPGTPSMLGFVDTDLDLKEIGRRLNVNNILAGSIRRSGDSIRVSAQLIRLEDDASIWAEKYDKDMKLGSIFAIQDDISRSIASVLEATLIGNEPSYVARRGTDDIEAYNSYIRGRHFWRKRSQEGLRTSIRHFENAVVLDPNYAAGWSGLADGWSMLANYRYVDHLTGYSKADTFSLRALELDANLAEAHAARGWLLYKLSRFHEAEKHLLRAIELNPGYLWGNAWYNDVLRALGRDEEASAREEMNRDLGARAPSGLHVMAGESRRSGNFQESIEYSKSALEIAPGYADAYWRLVDTYFDSGDTMMALETANRMISQIPDNWKAHRTRGSVLWRLGRLEEAQEEYEKSIEVAPDLSGPHENYADFLHRGRYNIPEAVKHAAIAVDLDSHNTYVRKQYSGMLRLAGRMDESLEQCKKIMELAPNDPESYRYFGWAIGNGRGRYDEAIEYMNRALELNPEHEPTYMSISLMYAFAGNSREALRAINRALELGSLRTDRIFRKAQVFAMGGMFDSAAVWFMKYHELDPYNSYTVVRLGDIHTLLGNYRIADSVYSLSLSHPDSIERGWGRSNSAETLKYQGRFTKALQETREAIEVDRQELGPCGPLFNKLLSCAAINLMFTNNLSDARKDVQGMKDVLNGMTSARPQLYAEQKSFEAWALATAGEPERGVRILEQALSEADPAESDIIEIYRYFLARTHRLNGDYGSSVELMEQVVDGNPNFSNRLHLGVSYLGAGETGRAVAILEKAMAIWDDNRFYNLSEAVAGHYYLGQAHQAAGRVQDAITQYETFLDIWKNADEGLKIVEDAIERLSNLKNGT